MRIKLVNAQKDLETLPGLSSKCSVNASCGENGDGWCRKRVIGKADSLTEGFFPVSSSGGPGTRVICSDCYDNANIYSRTREYCPYTYIAEEDVLDQTLSSLMVQMPKETYLAHPPPDAPALESLVSSADKEVATFPTNHERINEKKLPSTQMNSGKGHSLF